MFRRERCTCSFFIAEPSLLKYNSFAAAVTRGRVFRTTTLFLLPKGHEEIEAKDDNFVDEFTCFLSNTEPLGVTKEPTDDMAANVDAIYFLKDKRNELYLHRKELYVGKHRTTKVINNRQPAKRDTFTNYSIFM